MMFLIPSRSFFCYAYIGYCLAAPTNPHPGHFLLARDSIHNSSLPNVTIFATGGTIAGSATSKIATTGYTAGTLGIDVLIQAVPELSGIANVKGIQVANVDSSAINSDILLNLTSLIQAALDDPLCQGAVVTHGTDTLEETALFLDLTVKTEKPVVLVGAMRPATAISADGPFNILEAVTLAASPDACGRGSMIVLNDRIGSAYYTTKTHANSLDTFKAYEQGYLGSFLDAKPLFYFDPALPAGRTQFDISGATTLPRVDILFGHQSLNPALARAAVESGTKGLVLAGMGAGGWTAAGKDVVQQLIQEHGTQVVVSSRTMGGFVTSIGSENTYGGQDMNPQKARIMLQLALLNDFSSEQLAMLFKSI